MDHGYRLQFADPWWIHDPDDPWSNTGIAFPVESYLCGTPIPVDLWFVSYNLQRRMFISYILRYEPSSLVPRTYDFYDPIPNQWQWWCHDFRTTEENKSCRRRRSVQRASPAPNVWSKQVRHHTSSECVDDTHSLSFWKDWATTINYANIYICILCSKLFC